ncbi:MAG: sugar phosphate isomerase/epimerase family protein [Propylenella sp.]
MTTPDRVSFQLYSARKFPPLDTQLATLSAIGYRNVEPYGGLFADAKGLAAALKKHKLSTPTAHIGIDRLRSDVEGVATLAKEFGIKEIVVPAVPNEERTQGAAGWDKLGKELAGYAQKLAAHGVALAWHNHSFEFAKLPDGSYPLDHIFAAAPGLHWQVDIGWVQWAGEDPATRIKKYQGRVTSLHVKDLAPKGENPEEDGQADVGHGVIDWKKLMPAIKAPGVHYLIIEHDNPNDYRRFARRSFATVSAW